MEEMMNNTVENTTEEKINNFNVKDFAAGAAAGAAGVMAIYGIVKAVRNLIAIRRIRKAAENKFDERFDDITEAINNVFDENDD